MKINEFTTSNTLNFFQKMLRKWYLLILAKASSANRQTNSIRRLTPAVLRLNNKKQVAIVIPTHKSKLNTDDQTSLKHLKKYLNEYDRFFVIPESVDPKNFKQNDSKFIRLPNKFFKTWRDYNELLLNKEFYIKFKNYKYILIYQLDVLVFSDRLKDWCDKDYDFIAAPWFRPIIGWLSNKKGFPPSGGNGGFCLRKVSSSIKVLEEVNKRVQRFSNSSTIRRLWFLRAILTGRAHEIWLNAPADNYPFNEDGFWSLEAPKYIKGYKVAPFEEALRFAFEKFPRKCFELNSRKLPFGVHAWKKYDEEFWKPYLLP